MTPHELDKFTDDWIRAFEFGLTIAEESTGLKIDNKNLAETLKKMTKSVNPNLASVANLTISLYHCINERKQKKAESTA